MYENEITNIMEIRRNLRETYEPLGETQGKHKGNCKEHKKNKGAIKTNRMRLGKIEGSTRNLNGFWAPSHSIIPPLPKTCFLRFVIAPGSGCSGGFVPALCYAKPIRSKK